MNAILVYSDLDESVALCQDIEYDIERWIDAFGDNAIYFFANEQELV